MTPVSAPPLVLLATPVTDDVSAATEFGTVRRINKRYLYGDEISEDGRMPEPFLQNLRDAARDFRPAVDYMMIAGDQLQVVALAAMLAQYGEFRVLRWDRNARGYFPVVMSSLLDPAPAAVVGSPADRTAAR